MAPRANWKGYLKLALVTCPIALYPASTETEKIRFHMIHAKTGNRIRLRRVDEGTGDEVDNEDIIKGYEIAKGQFVRITPEELEAIEIESTRTINIDEFVPREEIDDLYNVRPYYVAPEGKIGAEAFVTIRETIAATQKVAIGRIVLSTREHMIALEPRGKGLMGTLLRYPYEVRDESAYFDDIPDIRIDKEMIDLAKHIVQSKSGHFEPQKFEDRYETAVRELIQRKAAGQEIKPARREEPSNVINLMDALRQSLAAEQKAPPSKAPAKRRGKSAASPRASAGKRRKAG
jgi:DNA end-binding protein Ku